MKKAAWAVPGLFLSLTMLLTGCGGGSAQNTSTSDKSAASGKAADEDTNLTDEITLWAFTDKVFQEEAQEFNKKYPNIKVNVQVMPFGDMHNKLQTTLTAGTGAPDVVEIEGGNFGRYNTLDALEDLTQLPYDAGKFKNDIPAYNWERWQSPDGKKLLGMPWDITPGVLYYRADIFDELGIPSDPEQLGNYIQDPQNWLNMANTLKANGKYPLEFRDLPVEWVAGTKGYFDKDWKWTRNTDDIAKVLDVSKLVQQQKLYNNKGMYSKEGTEALKQGVMPMIVLGSWGERDIAQRVPDQKGKWRVTRMPFGIYAGMGGSCFSIPSQSKHKKAAWLFTKWMTTTNDAWKIFTKPEYSIEPGYKPVWSQDWYINRKSDFLGGEEPYKLYNSLADKIPPIRYTPLDGKAWDIWLKGILKTIDNNLDSKAALQQIQEDEEKALGPDLEKLKGQTSK